MECHGFRADAGDWLTHHCHHPGAKGNCIFVPTPAISIQQGNVVSFQNMNDERVNSPLQALHALCQFSCLWLFAGGS